MSAKCALIVDDSRSARLVLQRMLETHSLDVDTAESAEQALEYLTDHRPDVIFMDHLMPGMDGFEAVRAIKANPDTATIPIMMYTSQEGELYVGQARALGAVGVLPKQIAPVEVSRVLESLHLVPIGARQDNIAGAGATQELESLASDVERMVGDDRDLRELIQELFEQQRAVIRRDLLDSYETIAARVADEIAPEAGSEVEDERPPSLSVPVAAALALLSLVTFAFGWLYWRAETNWQEAEARVGELQAERRERAQLSADGSLQMQASLSQQQEALEQRYQAALDLVAWSFNSGTRYGWDDIPLSEPFAARISELVRRLDELSFTGAVIVETHVGDFCYVRDATGTRQLAPPNLPVSACDEVGLSLAEADRAGSQQSVAFANLAETVGEQTDGRVSIVVATLANSAPALTYPSPGIASAGAWNAIAAANQRIELTLQEFQQDP